MAQNRDKSEKQIANHASKSGKRIHEEIIKINIKELL